ncbi:hypothetical protein BDV28DRAFT_58407 [Aspergillus coremiiformis]|uniref:Uncharacterized protein n=1 Tax=Aspergillus coremiiformis TaxID=138285 RepID=A0A5N6ZGA7_9EURO|nr:hypothetical protein BDV28DRAFT_58407 [Aspergillus coremiiformis]
MNGVRNSQVNRFSLDIKRKQVPSVSACRALETTRTDMADDTDLEPSLVNQHLADLTQDLEKEVIAALLFNEADHEPSYRGPAVEASTGFAHTPSGQAFHEEGNQQEFPGNSASSAHELAPVKPYKDCPPRKPLLTKDKSPAMTPIQVVINDAPLLVPEYNSDPRDIGDRILSWTEQANNSPVHSFDDPADKKNSVQPPSPECTTTTPPSTRATPSMGKPYYSSVMETQPKPRDVQRSENNTTLLEPDHHQRGSSLQVRLEPMPSISSLGTLDADRDPQQPLGQVLASQANSSRVSFLSEGGDGQHQRLGGTVRPDHPTRTRDRPKSPWPGDEAEHASRRLSGAFRPLLSSRPRAPDAAAPQSTEHACSAKQTTAQKALSTMDRLRFVGNKIRRPSMGSESYDPKTSPPHRKALNKISGFFNRSNARAGHDRPDSRATGSHVPAATTQRQVQSMDRLYPISSQSTSPEISRPRSTIENHASEGQTPPPGSYFAPESFACLRDPQEPGAPVEDISGTAPMDFRHHRHSGSGRGTDRLTPQSPVYRPSGSPQLQQHQQLPTASPLISSPPRASPSSCDRPEERTYAQDLNIRSRSPKAFAPRPEERHIPSADISDPAYQLGTFRQNPRTSRIGDQERPWKLTIPGETEDDTPDDALTWRQETTEGVLQCGQLPTYEEDSRDHHHHHPPSQENPRDEKPPLTTITRPSTPPLPQSPDNTHPTRGEGRVLNLDAPVELPAPVDDDSSEEILMSSTAYPGQEWKPVGFLGWQQ